MNQQLALAIQLNDEATLADFFWGNNLFLKEQLMRSFQGNGERFFYLWGNSGNGKTHLLQACCHHVSSTQIAIYLPLDILKNWEPDVIDGLEGQTLITIDDVANIAGNPQWEEALFHLYNRVKENEHTRIIMTGSTPPNLLPIQLLDLRSRLNWGLVMQIHELEDEEKLNALSLYAHKRGFYLSTGVGQFLLNRCSRNMHDLLQLLNRLDEASLVAQRKITIPFVKNVLGL
jgi:DnaA family protein